MSNLSNDVEYSDYGAMCLLSLANKHSGYDTYFSDTEDPCVIFEAGWDQDGVFEELWITLCQEATYGSSFAATVGTVYYCRLSRSAGSGTVTLQIFSDAARTNLLATLTDTGYPTDRTWRYLYAIRGTDTTGEWTANYYVQNVDVISY